MQSTYQPPPQSHTPEEEEDSDSDHREMKMSPSSIELQHHHHQQSLNAATMNPGWAQVMHHPLNYHKAHLDAGMM